MTRNVRQQAPLEVDINALPSILAEQVLTLAQARKNSSCNVAMPSNMPLLYRELANHGIGSLFGVNIFLITETFPKPTLQSGISAVLAGTGATVHSPCGEYEQVISRAGGLHLSIIEINDDGSVGFNRRGISKGATHLQELPLGQIAWTMGITTLRGAEQIVVASHLDILHERDFAWLRFHGNLQIFLISEGMQIRD